LQDLAKISDTEGSLARTFFSPAHKKSAEQLKEWMQQAGLVSWMDVLGNVHGVLEAATPGQPAILVGSHYDTVLDAGKYDGAMGIIAGLSGIKMAILSELHAQGKLEQVALPAGSDVHIPTDLAQGLLAVPVHLVAFTDEEGVRFKSTFLGSRAVAGTLLKHGLLDAKDAQGSSLREVLVSEGRASAGNVLDLVAALAMNSSQVAEYVELHIEQGPVLERKNLALGVVSAIVGQSRMWVSINGTQGHAGTVPMVGREDSLVTAAEAITLLERRCGGGPGAPAAGTEGVMEHQESDMLVCTVGEVRVWPNAPNVIPGNVQFSVDIRTKDDALRDKVVVNVTQSIYDLCARRGVSCHVSRNHDADAVLADTNIVADLVEAIRTSRDLLGMALKKPGGEGAGAAAASCSAGSSGEAECGGDNIPVMVSGAGHDAMAVADITKFGMLFVRCRGGISHSSLEHAEEDDITASAAALTRYLLAKSEAAAAKAS